MYRQMMKFPDRSVCDLSEMNPLGDGGSGEIINPNSAILTYF